MRFVLAVLLTMTAMPAMAKDITFTMTDEDQKVFWSMLDLTLKQGGLANLAVVSTFIKKFQDAAGPAPKPEQPKK